MSVARVIDRYVYRIIRIIMTVQQKEKTSQWLFWKMAIINRQIALLFPVNEENVSDSLIADSLVIPVHVGDMARLLSRQTFPHIEGGDPIERYADSLLKQISENYSGRKSIEH
jgi:hypothetical protein